MATPVNNWEKAKLVVEGGGEIEMLFNPKEYTVAKESTWTPQQAPGTPIPPMQYGGGKGRTIALSGLLLDASLKGPGGHIRAEAEALFGLLGTPSGSSAGAANAVPPLVTFQWGQNTSFKSVITTLSVAYKLFHPNGDPIRAEVTMNLTEAEQTEAAAQNPTTRAEAGLGVHLVKDGDSLQSIAYRTYGDATRWRTIAQVNGIDNPLALRRGTPLMLPRLEG